MPYTYREAAAKLSRNGKPITVTENDFVAGQGDGVTTSSGDKNLFAQTEIGETSGKLDEYKAVILGQNPGESERTAQAKPDLQYNASGPALLDSNTEFKFVRTAPGDIDGKGLFGWELYDQYDQANVSNSPGAIPALRPQRIPVVEGELIRNILRNENTSITPSFSDSSINLPAIAVK